MAKLERAEAHTDRGIRIESIKRELRMVRAGGRTCEGCKYRTATKLFGSPGSTLAYCDDCALNDSLNRRLARMRAERERMRTRR